MQLANMSLDEIFYLTAVVSSVVLRIYKRADEVSHSLQRLVSTTQLVELTDDVFEIVS